MRIQNRSAQAALEFLVTYGWAFLVILVMIGALTHFGVLNPANLVPESCIASSGVICREMQIAGDTITLVLHNGREPVQIDPTKVRFDVIGAADPSCGAGDVTINGANTIQTIQANEQYQLNIACSTLKKGERPRVNVDVEFTVVGSQLPTLFTVDVTGEVGDNVDGAGGPGGLTFVLPAQIFNHPDNTPIDLLAYVTNLSGPVTFSGTGTAECNINDVTKSLDCGFPNEFCEPTIYISVTDGIDTISNQPIEVCAGLP